VRRVVLVAQRFFERRRRLVPAADARVIQPLVIGGEGELAARALGRVGKDGKLRLGEALLAELVELLDDFRFFALADEIVKRRRAGFDLGALFVAFLGFLELTREAFDRLARLLGLGADRVWRCS
jgi:hypothetical protein